MEEVPISNNNNTAAAAPPGTTLRRPIAASAEDEMMGYEEDITGNVSWSGEQGITFTPSPHNNNYGGDTSSIWSADDPSSNHGGAGAAAAAGGGWMMGLVPSPHPSTWNKRTKILIGLIATTTLLCAIATGGGVAAAKQRAANANKSWCVDTTGGLVDIDEVTAAVSAKAAKAATVTSTKSSKAPSSTTTTTKSKSPTSSVKSSNKSGGRERRTLEERRRGRVLAATQLGRRAVVVEEEGGSSGVLTNLWNGFISEAVGEYYYGEKGSDVTTTHHVRRNLSSSKSKSKSPSRSKSKSPSRKSSSKSKSPTAKSGKASGDRIEIDKVEKYPSCQCVDGYLGAYGVGGAKSNKGSSSGVSAVGFGSASKSKAKSSGAAAAFGLGSTSKSSTSKGSATTAKSSTSKGSATTAKSSSKSSTAKGSAGIGALGSPSGGSKSNKYSGGAGSPGISEGKPAQLPSLCYTPNEIKPKSKSGGPGTGSAVYSAKSEKYSAKSEKQTKPLPDPIPDPAVPRPVPTDPIVPATKPPTPRPSPRPTEPCKECDEIIPEIVTGDKPTPSGPPTPSGDVPRPTPPFTPSEVVVPPPPSPTSPDSPPGPPSSPSSPTPPAPTPADRPSEPAETPNVATNCLNDPSWTSTDGDDCDAVEANPVSLCNTASSSGGVSATAACPAACNTECLDNCDIDPNWSTGSGETCDDVAKDPIGLCGSVGTTSGSGAVTAIDACPTSCKDECLDDCDNDPFWITKDGDTCDNVATDPKELCDKLKGGEDDEKASTACPAACNFECYDNCDNSPFWENGNKQGCADVAKDPETLCDTVDKGGVPANDACPASCKAECLSIPEDIEEIVFPPPAPTTPSPPVPSPITPSGGGGGPEMLTYVPTSAWVFPTFKPTNGASVTVGQGAESAPTLPPAGRLDGTPFPTDVVPTIPTAKPTPVASGGVTITVSTETTGPPTMENREPDSA